MNKCLILVSLFAFTACGKNEALRTNLRILAGTNGKADTSDVGKLEHRIVALEAAEGRFQAIETDIQTLMQAQSVTNSHVSALLGQIETLEDDEETNAADIAVLRSQLLALQTQADLASSGLSTLQIQANQTQAELTELSESLDGEERVVAYLDPCGDHAGSYDEVLMRTNTGKVIAYFENGSQRHLSVLNPDTDYGTTDLYRCYFRVTATGQMYNEHY